MSEFLTEVTDSSFEREVLSSTWPVLVHFWAPWCEECHLLSAVLREIGQEYAGRIEVATLNVDENEVTTLYCIDVVPTLILFKSGMEQDRIKKLTSRSAISR